MKTPKISVIVPVYNVEKYLPECIESILAQTFTDFELLLIDDGSPDNSRKICDKYAAQDCRIRVFHKPNGGVSSSRNLGLDNANGEWITFVDADDSLQIDALETFSKFFYGYDMIRFSMGLVNNPEKSDINYIEIDENDTKEEYTAKVVSRNAILGICGGIYKKSIFEDNNIRFDPNLINGEDWIVQFKCLIHSNTIKVINKPLYLYTKYNETSCTNFFRFEVHYSALQALEEIKNVIKNHPDIIENRKYKNELTRAKCMLIYDYLANKILHKHKVNPLLSSEYSKHANLTFTELFKAHIPPKWRILLILYLIGFIN